MKTAAEYQKAQRDLLKRAAEIAGYPSIFALARAIIKGDAKVVKTVDKKSIP